MSADFSPAEEMSSAPALLRISFALPDPATIIERLQDVLGLIKNGGGDEALPMISRMAGLATPVREQPGNADEAGRIACEGAEKEGAFFGQLQGSFD
jgi:hypothetical protein